MTEQHDHACAVCHRPDRIPHRPLVCNGCRRMLSSALIEVVDLCDSGAQAASIRAYASRKTGPRVSGSATPPVPADLRLVDLLGPARVPNPTRDDAGRPHQRPDDADGGPSAATVLDSWARDWRDALWPDHRLPVPTVPALAAWLGNRLDDACDQLDTIGDFGDELRSLRSTLRTALDLNPFVARLHAPCPTCDQRALYREGGAEYVRCGGCGRLWTEDEYQRLAIVAAESVA